MRKLASAGFSFAAFIAAAHYLLPRGWTYIIALAVMGLGVAAALLLRHDARTRAVIICVAGAVALGWYGLYSQIYLGSAEKYVDTTDVVTVRVVESVHREDGYASVDVKLAEAGAPALGIRVMDYSGTLPELRAGDLARMELEFIDAGVRYGEESDYYAARGVHLRAYFSRLVSSDRDAVSLLYFPSELARLMSESIRRCFPEDVQTIMLALLIGDTDDVYDDAELDTALTMSGTSHVVSVSGMHLSFLFAAVTMLVGKRRAALFGAPLVIVFTFMAGCTSAVVRACVMLLMGMAAPLFKRESDPLTSLAFALMLLLAANPLSIGSVSLQLSFAAMLGMELVSSKLYERLMRRFAKKGAKRWRRLRSAVIASVTSSIGAIAFTTPIVAAVFGNVPLVSPVANLLTLWAVSAAFTLGFAAAVLGMILPVAGVVVAWVAAWPARLFVSVISRLAALPFAAVYTEDGLIVWWLVFSYVLFIAAYLAARHRGGHVRILVPAVCSAAVLVTVLIAAQRAIEREHSVTVLDVGQGQSVAFLSGESTMVVDCGGRSTWDPAGDITSEYLLSLGRRDVDALVLTHLHSDHANGAVKLMTRLDVDMLYLPAGADDADGELAGILEAAERNGTGVVYVESDMTLELGGISADLIAPEPGSTDNERGIVLTVDVDGYDAVVTGDAGSSTERRLVESDKIGRAELLVAGHHGSRYSNSFELVDAVQPETVVISVGYNSYGHPTEDAMVRLGVTGAELYRTDENGNVTIRIDENGEER